MTTQHDPKSRLLKKGELTILERPEKKTFVALKAGGNIVSLEGFAPPDQLLAELLQVCQHWPDKGAGK
jgi:hypothetical protein